MITVILADDHKLVRDGLRSILGQAQGEIAVAGEAASGEEVMDLLEKGGADLVLMDVNMPGMNGIDATRRVRERFPGVKVLMLSMMDNEAFIDEALRAGAQGYLLKNCGHKELLRAIRTVAGGEEYISSDIARMLLKKLQEASPEPASGPVAAEGAAIQAGTAAISPRELEVLQLIAKGHTNHQISELLFSSRRTVETHRQNLLLKTGTNNTATLILYAASHGLLGEP
jgi:DNA-binding NarL/FixJ family response regulator